MEVFYNRNDIEQQLATAFQNRYKRKDAALTGILLARPRADVPKAASRPLARRSCRTFGVIGCTSSRLGYDQVMHAITGTVVGGKIVVEGLSLPEGTVVTVLPLEADKSLKLPPHLEKELLEAIDEADQEVGGAGPEFLESLRRYG